MKSRWSWLATLALLVVGATAMAGPLRAQEVTESPHGALPRGLDCSACHLATAWTPARVPKDFDHAKWGGFALEGRHRKVACVGCHLDARFDQPKTAQGDCAGCHADVHGGRLAGGCGRCHDASSFANVPAIQIHARTGFALTGAHLQITCQSCHVDDRAGGFTRLDARCVSCHRRDFQGATSIDHVAQGFSTECTQCHSTVAWADAPAFDHAATGFALLGAHAGLRCESCHTQPGNGLRFPTTDQNDCIGCHQSDYDRAHSGSGFPTTCTSCHGLDRWGGASFAEHDSQYFPIYSGAHKGRWNRCQDCHTAAPADYVTFSCVTCHERSRTDSRHQDVRNYVYDSQACYQCHPRGRGGD